jgi:hypothetical protein
MFKEWEKYPHCLSETHENTVGIDFAWLSERFSNDVSRVAGSLTNVEAFRVDSGDSCMSAHGSPFLRTKYNIYTGTDQKCYIATLIDEDKLERRAAANVIASEKEKRLM